MKIKAAVIQFDVKVGDKERNLRRAAGLLREAAAAGAGLIVLPEMWNTGFAPKSAGEFAEDAQGPSVALLRNIAAEYHTCIIGGSIAEQRQEGLYNTMFVMGADGRAIAKYRKVHLFTQLRENEYFCAGDELKSFDYEQDGQSVNVGLSLCYDLRFPEMYRNLALRDARILAVPSAWPAARLDEFALFCRARAAENRAFVLAANYTDTEKNIYSGGSMIVNPGGELLVRGGNCEGCFCAELDSSLLHDSRLFYSLDDRQPFIDEIDNNLL